MWLAFFLSLVLLVIAAILGWLFNALIGLIHMAGFTISGKALTLIITSYVITGGFLFGMLTDWLVKKRRAKIEEKDE